jgi:hypothetical protein
VALIIEAPYRDIANRLYISPQIPQDQFFSEVVRSTYRNDYRRAIIEHPRLRFDGVYIAVCHCMCGLMSSHVKSYMLELTFVCKTCLLLPLHNTHCYPNKFFLQTSWSKRKCLGECKPLDNIPSLSVSRMSSHPTSGSSTLKDRRFYPDGTVLSLLANDDNPSEIVGLLRPSYRRPVRA